MDFQALRSEMASLQSKLVEVQIATSERRKGAHAAGDASTPAAIPARSSVAPSELEHVLSAALAEAQHLEQQSRALLASSRGEQLATQRALLLQIRRMQALEMMRMADLQVKIQTGTMSRSERLIYDILTSGMVSEEVPELMLLQELHRLEKLLLT